MGLYSPRAASRDRSPHRTCAASSEASASTSSSVRCSESLEFPPYRPPPDTPDGLDRDAACGADIDACQIGALSLAIDRIGSPDVSIPAPAVGSARQREVDRDGAIPIGLVRQLAVHQDRVAIVHNLRV